MSKIADARPGGRIFYNGVVHTVDEGCPRASVVAVDGARIVYVGDDARIASRLLPACVERIDLGGLAVVPGLADGHMHFLMEGQRLAELDAHMASKEDVLRRVAERARNLRPGEWIVGRGWNHELWPGRQWPCKEDLDAVAPDNPVALTRLDGHSLWVNSPALRAAGFDRNSPDMFGGEILRNTDGELLGVLVDAPAFRVREAMPAQTTEQKREACLRAQAEMFSYGVTSVGDAWQFPDDHALLREMYAAGELRIRIYGMLASAPRNDRARPGVNMAPVSGLFGARLSLRAFKIVLDGSLGSRSAWLTEGYADRPGHTGNHRYADDELLALACDAARAGFQVCVHAIGDAAVLQAVRMLEALRRENIAPWLPHRIEHFQIASRETVARALALGVVVAMQTAHAVADKPMAEARLGPELLRNAYPWREVLDGGGIVVNGTDSPMDGANPFYGFHAALSRTAFSGCDNDVASLRMTREEALRSYTLWPARGELAGNLKGRLAPGMAADFVVLDRDILTCSLEDIAETRVLTTVLAGETVYGGL